MNPERKQAEIIWKQNKAENRSNNMALHTGWDGGIYRRGITARILFKDLPKPKYGTPRG